MRILVVLVLASSLLACAGGAWRSALKEDTASAYHRFLIDHPDASQAPLARERLAFVRIRNKPTAAAYEQFKRDFPGSALLPELAPYAEEPLFQQARAAGTPEAYRAFAREFPGGLLRARAEGNAEFLEKGGFGGDPVALAEFAERHPDSDFAAEAARSAAALAVRARTAIRRVGLVVTVDPGTPGPDRLARAFTEHAAKRYAEAGLELFPLAGESDPRGASFPAKLVIHHSEREVKTELGRGNVSRPGVLAETRVELRLAGEKQPVWADTFSYRASIGEVSPQRSVVFGPGGGAYWESFYIPFATWKNRAAVRSPMSLSKPPAAVETVGSRAVVLFEDGDFQIFDLADPTQPVLVGEYQRARDLTRWSGVRLVGDRVLIYGEDGLEVVQLTPAGPKREANFGRGVVGWVVSAVPYGNDWILAGKRGLQRLPVGGGDPVQLVEREIRGLDRVGPHLIFTDESMLFVSTPELVKQQRVEAELQLGRGFGPGRVRADGTSAIVLGERGMIRLDVSNPARPRMLSRITTDEVGPLRDAALAGGRLFLLGQRGLLVVDATGERVVDTADVDARMHLGAAGRHLVMIGDGSLQVVDSTPFVKSLPAAPDGAR